MSRTDVHRPPWVQVQDKLLHRHMSIAHHHWERDCYDSELREWLVERTAPCDVDTPGGRCERWPRGRNLFCGCRMCTGQPSRRRARRRDRTVLRTQLRTAVKTAPADREDIDIPGPAPIDW
jgi:hypothetical protein